MRKVGCSTLQRVDSTDRGDATVGLDFKRATNKLTACFFFYNAIKSERLSVALTIYQRSFLLLTSYIYTKIMKRWWV